MLQIREMLDPVKKTSFQILALEMSRIRIKQAQLASSRFLL